MKLVKTYRKHGVTIVAHSPSKLKIKNYIVQLTSIAQLGHFIHCGIEMSYTFNVFLH